MSRCYKDVKTVYEDVSLNSGDASIKRTNEYAWIDDYFTVNFSTNTGIKYTKYDIQENISVNMKNHKGIVIKFDYNLMILDGANKHTHRLYNFEYNFAENNLVELDKFYSKDVNKIYNEFKAKN